MSLLDNTLQADARTEEETAVPPVPPAPAQPQQQPAEEPPAPTEEEMTNALLAGPRPVENTNRDLNAEADRTAGKADFDRAMADEYRRQHAGVADARREAQANALAASAEDAENAARLHRRELAKSAMQDAFGKIYDYSVREGGFLAPAQDGWSIGRMCLEDIRNYLSSSMVDDDSEEGRATFDYVSRAVLNHAGRMGLLKKTGDETLGEDEVFWSPTYGVVFGKGDRDAERWVEDRGSYIENLRGKLEAIDSWEGEKGASDPANGIKGASIRQIKGFLNDPAWRNRGDLDAQIFFSEAAAEIEKRYDETMQKRSVGRELLDSFVTGSMDAAWFMPARVYKYLRYIGADDRHDPNGRFLREMRKIKNEEDYLSARKPQRVAGLEDIHLRDENGELQAGRALKDFGSLAATSAVNLLPQIALQMVGAGAVGKTAQFLTKGASLAAKEAVASAVGKAVSYGGSALFNAGDVISQRVEEGLARGDSEVFSDWDIVRLTLGYTALDTVSPIRQTASEVAQSAVLRSGRRTAGRVTREALRRDLAKQMDEWIPTGRQIVRNFFKEGGLEAANEAGQQGLSYLDNWIKYGAPGHKSLDEADWDLAAFALNMANQGFAAFWSAAGGSVVSDVQKRRDNTRKAEQAQSWMSHHMAETIARDVRDAGFDPDFHKLAPQEQYLVFRLFGLRASDHNARMGLAGAKRMLDFAEGREAIPEGMDEKDLAEFKKKLEDKDALRKSVADWQKVLDDVRRQELGVMDYLEGPARAWARAWSAKVVSLPEDGIPSSVQSSLRAEEAERSFKRGRDIREGAVEAGETGAAARISTWGEDENPDSSHRMMIEEQRSPDGKDFVIRVWNAYNKDRLPEGVQTEFEIGEDGATEDEVREKAKAAAVELTRFYDFLAQQDERMTAEASAILDSIGRKGQTIRWVSTKAEIERTLQKLGVADRETRDNVLGRLIGRGDSAITVDLGAGRSAILAVRERAVNRANLAATLQHESFHADLIANAERNRTNKELLADIDPDGKIGEPPAEPPEGASPSAVNEYRRKRAAYDARVRRCLDVAFLGLDVDKSGRTVDWTTVTDEQIEAREEEYARASETVDGVGSSGTRPSYFRPMRRMLYNRYVARHPVLAAELRGFLADRFGIAESDDEAAAEFVSIVHEGAGRTAANDISGPGRLEYSAKTSEEVYKLLMGEDAVPPTREERERRRKEENDRLVREANERMAAEQQAEAEAIARYDAQQRESAAEKAEEAQRADEETDLRARADAQDAAEKADEQARQRHTERENAAAVERVKAKRAARKEQMRRSLQERASRAKSDRVNKIYWRFEDFLDKYHPDVMDDEAWQKGNAEQLSRLEKGLRENNPQIVLEATEALRKKLRGRPSPTTEARARESAEREQAEADRREQEAIRRENEAEEAGLRALEEQEEAQRQDERAEGERAAQGAVEAEAAEHADNPLAVEADRKEAEAARLEAIAKEKESKAKRGGKDKAAAEKARRLADRARKEAKAARAAQLGERTTSAYWANRPILDREDARDRRTARRRNEALQAEYDRLIAAGASEAQARRQANMAVTPARLNSRNVAGRPAVVAQNPGRFPIHEALEGRTLFGEVRPGDEAWEYVSDMTSRDAREAGLADRLLPKERGSRGLDSVVEALAENSPVLAARYGEDASGSKAAELVDAFLAETREIDELVADGALSEQERYNEDEEIEANRRWLGFYDERYEGMDDPERLAHIRDEVEARVKGMAPALPAEVAEAAAQDKAALDAQEELEAESPEAVQARRDSEAERARQRFQESLVAQQEDEFYGDDYLAESAPGVRSRGADTETEGVAEPGIDAHLDAVEVPADRREEAKKAIQQELFSIDEMSKDGFLYPRSPEAEAEKPRKKISMRKPAPAPTVYTAEEKKRAFRALNSEEYAAENPADLALAKRMLDDGLTVSSVIGELYSGERFTWPVRGFRIAKPADVAALTQMLRSPYQESFKVVFTDARGTILDARVCSFGDIDACPVNPSTVLLDAPEGTVGVYVSHNHPSGDPRPSSQDVRITRSLGETCEMLGYELLDHVVTNGAKFHSMRDSGDAEFSEGRRMRPAGNLRPGERAVPEFKRDVKAWEAVPVDERWQNDRPEEAFALAGRFRALETGGAFIVTLDRKCKLTGVSKMTPDELARPDAGREMLRRVQRVKEACCWMIVVGDAGIDLDRFARRSSGGMDARIGKPLVDVFLRDESGRFYSTRRQGVLRFDEYTGFEGATYDEMRRLGLTRDTVERYVAEHPAPQLDEGLDSDSTYDAEPARIRSRSATSAESAELEAGKKIRVFRAMQLIDGKLYPPMAAVVDGALVEPTELGKWYVADERPDLADENGRFKLDKGNGSSIKAAYNPYWHTSRSPLNDQFSSAWKRTNLVTVECEVPASELTSGYKAEKAKDAVGEMDWHSGPVSSKLAKVGLKRKVILSRYCKVLRVIPDAEVADAVSRMLKGKGISIPADVVTPSLRKELLARGVKVTPTKNVADVFAWKQLDRKVDESTRMEFQADPFTRDWTVWSEPDYIAALPVHTLSQMGPISDRTDNNSVEKALQSLFDRFGEVTNEDTEEKVVFNRGDAGKMMMQSGVDMRTFGPHLKHLFEKSVLAWTEPERSMNKHKFHENVEQYRQYVAKFDGYTDVGHGIAGAAFVRFTVRVMNTGRHGVHAASISDISVIQKQKGGPQPVPARKLGGIGDLALRDRTLAKFLAKGKNEFSEPESRVRSRGGLSLDDVYGVRTRDVVEQIKLRRHEYDYDPQKRHVCDMVEEAFAKAQADPTWFKSVVDRALAPVKPGDQPPAFNTQEQGALMLDMHLRAEAADVAATRLAALKAAGASVDEIAAANARYAELEAARFAMEEAYIRQGKALSDAMNQRKAAFDKSTGSFAGLMEAFEQATGRKPGASERARIRDAWREIERLRKALADAIRDVGNRDFDAAMAAIMSLDLDDLLRRRRSGPGRPGKAGAKGEADRSAWPKTREELEALAKERAKDLDLDRDDPEAMRLLLRPFVRWVGKCILNVDVEAGREMGAPEAFRSALGDVCRSVLGEEFADWSDRTWGDIYSNYGVMTPASTDELKVRISQMTALQRLVSQLQDLENRMRPLKTGPQRVAMESQAEALRAEINAKMKELNLPIPEGADPSRYIKSPQEIQKEAMRKAIERLERAIRDGVPFPKNADPIALDEEGQALRTLLEDLRKQYKEAFPLSDAEIVKRIVKAYEKAEERAQRELDAALAGNFRGAPAETREKLLRENDLRVQVMRERVAMLREARQELEDAAGPEAYYSEWSKAVRRAVQSKLNAAQRYHDWIANPSEFEKWQKKRQNKLDVGDDPAVKDAQKKLDDARLAWFRTLDDLAWSDMNWLEKTWETLVGVSDISKRFIASADLSSIGIQAAVAAILRDPSLGWRTAKDALWAKGGKGFAFSEEKCRELLEKMQNDPEWHTVVDLMGIRISDWHADSGDFGEEYRKAGIAARRGLGISKMLNDNKILRFGDRTYTMPLNLIRFAYAKQMIAHLTKMYGEAYLSTEQGRKDLKLLGRVVNMETGRGDWFTKNAAGSFVSKILWAPGKFAGQLQTMFLPITLLLNDNRASARTRAMVFRQCWLRPLAGWAILVMFLRAIAHLLGDDDRRDEIGDFMETNPINPMFGRVNLGGRRFSLSAGMESYISVASRVAMMKTASKYDEEKRLADPTGPIVNTLSNKFNPPVGIAWRLARRKDVDGTKLDNPGAVAYFLFKNLCFPITGTDFTKTALDLKPGEFLTREDAEARTGILHKAVLLPLSFLGVSSNRYGWDSREADVANFDRLAKEFKALAKVYENKGGTYSANEIAKAREGILNLRGDPVLGLYAKEWTRGKELRDRLRQIENAIKAEGKERKPDKERLAQLEQLRGETLTVFHRLYHPQFARDAR